ncbi:MAG: hypothetical protein ACI845_003003 [Gammaproteobacteria bacterium]|jgi:hypothetical protein
MDDLKTIQLSKAKILIAIIWPSFLKAILATGLFFAAFHPYDLIPFGVTLSLTLVGVYTIGFFLFWCLAIIASAASMYFAISNGSKISQISPRDQILSNNELPNDE